MRSVRKSTVVVKCRSYKALAYTGCLNTFKQRCLKYIWVVQLCTNFPFKRVFVHFCSLALLHFFQVQCKKLIFGFKGKEAEDLSSGSRFNTSAEHRVHTWHVLVVWLGYLWLSHRTGQAESFLVTKLKRVGRKCRWNCLLQCAHACVCMSVQGPV